MKPLCGPKMADVFISYSKKNRDIAASLATDLQGVGATVWWDTDLYTGDDFHDTIAKELSRALAVIVIWSDDSVASKWVRGEATIGARGNKLVPTHLDGFDFDKIPIPFQGHHCSPVSDRKQILRALDKLGVRRAVNEDHVTQTTGHRSSKTVIIEKKRVKRISTSPETAPNDATRGLSLRRSAEVAGNPAAELFGDRSLRPSHRRTQQDIEDSYVAFAANERVNGNIGEAIRYCAEGLKRYPDSWRLLVISHVLENDPSTHERAEAIAPSKDEVVIFRYSLESAIAEGNINLLKV